MRSTRFVAAPLLALALLAVVSPLRAAEVKLDRTQRFQTIDGFGFFGAHDVWWGTSEDVVNAAWFDAVINDLGITVWRNEIHPPADSIASQDADWPKQQPVVQGISNAAKASGVPLKVILSVWSPPSSMKCATNDSGVRDGVAHPGGTKNGGGLCPSKRAEFANYLVAAIKQYADLGVEVYGLSFQNEPLFVEPYNSCVYNQKEYADTLATIGPILHGAYPKLKLFGSENMLAIECGGANGFDPYWYTSNIMNSSAAVAELGMWAVHGYSDGVLATPTSQMSKYWASFYSGTVSSGLPIWMTETSGYVDTIEGSGNLPGAIDLAQAIYAGLYHGHMSAWVWWQGSELGSSAPSEFGLMSGTSKRGKKYYVSKNYYRYIRPGAKMVAASSDDPEVLVTAFDHDTSKAFTVVAINGSKSTKTVTLTGASIPSEFEAYRTSASEDCASVGPVTATTITLPARSITTFVNGKATVNAGDGGSTGVIGSTGAGGGSKSQATNTTVAGLGGGTASGTAKAADKNSASGCGCRLSSRPPNRDFWPFILMSLGLVLRRPRRR